VLFRSVDYSNQERTLKSSARWYADFLRRQKALREQREPMALADFGV
jgi:hypothetical protein